ncbi:MAG: DUF2442 domain-containing protein [Odoribacter sp.]|nr:DUF2442 domain-containing protein [Odoribacter sp.]
MTIKKLWFEDEKIFIQTGDGKVFWQSFLWYPRLKNATEEERNDYRINRLGIRWESIDEDISFESFTYDQPEPQGISRLFLTHPELNASAIARRLGMKQSLLAQYINGTKKPSPEREKLILDEIRKVGLELSNVAV